MKRYAAQFFLGFILAAILLVISGCASDRTENTSVRPWNAPQGWENGAPIMNYQHE